MAPTSAALQLLLAAVLAAAGYAATTAARAVTDRATAPRSDVVAPRQGSRIRAADAGDSHAHEAADAASTTTCAVDVMQLVLAFNEVAEELNVTGLDGELCSLPVPKCDHHDDDQHDDGDEDHHDDGDEDHHGEIGEQYESGSGTPTDPQCHSVYDTCVELLVHTNLISATCLSGECVEEDSNATTSTSSRPSEAEAYGYGFLMVCLVSLGSLLGILVVPLITTKDKKKSSWKILIYKYTYSFMIALGISSLLCDAVLHLLPHAWDLHAHEDPAPAADSHGHMVDDTAHGHGKRVEEYLWKGTIAILAVYLFYLLEFLLHSFTSHTHSHGLLTDTAADCDEEKKECIQLDTSVPHGRCSGTNPSGHVIHPSGEADHESLQELSNTVDANGDVLVDGDDVKATVRPKRWFLLRIKPLAWLIIVGDGLHNFADGLALGAAISQSLALGVSTMIALMFHEIPHEFGDYVILLSTGLSWYAALLFNFISALTAVIGFFIGVAIGTKSEEVNGWILAFAAGLFIYIALVDLLPELIHTKEKGGHRWGLFLAANCGFFLSFLALFLIAVYEEDLNTLIS